MSATQESIDPDELRALEQLLFQSAPVQITPLKLKGRIFEKVRQQDLQQKARRQLLQFGVVCVLSCLCIAFGAQWLGGQSGNGGPVQPVALLRPSPSGNLHELAGAAIGEWGHVEFLLRCRQDVAEKLSLSATAVQDSHTHHRPT